VVTEELTSVLGLRGAPAFARVFPHQEAIPQYNVGHARRLARIDQRLQRWPGLLLAGNAYRGIGVNDCVRNAGPVAEQVLRFVGETARPSATASAR
jgi:oxygen-dependent protoporphyrinogen oxidase